eukprot:6189941-Pleurochrysis_carterae.AAC.1
MARKRPSVRLLCLLGLDARVPMQVDEAELVGGCEESAVVALVGRVDARAVGALQEDALRVPREGDAAACPWQVAARGGERDLLSRGHVPKAQLARRAIGTNHKGVGRPVERGDRRRVPTTARRLSELVLRVVQVDDSVCAADGKPVAAWCEARSCDAPALRVPHRSRVLDRYRYGLGAELREPEHVERAVAVPHCQSHALAVNVDLLAAEAADRRRRVHARYRPHALGVPEAQRRVVAAAREEPCVGNHHQRAHRPRFLCRCVQLSLDAAELALAAARGPARAPQAARSAAVVAAARRRACQRVGRCRRTSQAPAASRQTVAEAAAEKEKAKATLRASSPARAFRSTAARSRPYPQTPPGALLLRPLALQQARESAHYARRFSIWPALHRRCGRRAASPSRHQALRVLLSESRRRVAPLHARAREH